METLPISNQYRMIKDIPNQNQSRVFYREKFLKELGFKLYGDIDSLNPENYRKMYEIAYLTFHQNQGKPTRIEPEPTPLEEIKGDITLEQLADLELSISIMYASGFTILCQELGRDPLREI